MKQVDECIQQYEFMEHEILTEEQKRIFRIAYNMGVTDGKKGSKSFVGKKITNFYCNGFFGRRYDLEDSEIINCGHDYITIRLTNGEVSTATFEGWQLKEMEELVKDWTKEGEDD